MRSQVPNILTILRVALVPVFIMMLVRNEPEYRLAALAVFILASVTDFFDGYLARKWNQESKFGRFLDPLADKLLVVSSILIFIELDPQIPLWMLLAIIARDMLITLLRYLAIRKGMEVKTSRLGKAKTMFQMLSIVLIMVILIMRSYKDESNRTFTEERKTGKKNIEIAYEQLRKGLKILPEPQVDAKEKRQVFAESVPYFLMFLTTIVTVISGFRYLFTNYRVLYPPYYIFSKKHETGGHSE